MSKLSDAMAWFKGQFGAQIQAGIQTTPFSVDMLTAIAVQETFEIWGALYQSLPVDEVLELCVGDTLDAQTDPRFLRTKLHCSPRRRARRCLRSLGKRSSR